MNSIKLKGPKKYITANPLELFLIKSGKVSVYVVCVSSGRLLRSVHLCEAETGFKLPTLSAAAENNRSYHLLFIGEMEAEIEVLTGFSDEEKLEVRNDFLVLSKIAEKSDDNTVSCDFTEGLVEHYNKTLAKESEEIKGLHEERIKVRDRRNRLILSMFVNKNLRDLEIGSGSILYDAVNIYCRGRDIEVCSYQALNEAYGNDFDVTDIARASNFVCRKITLPKNWYRKRADAFIGFNKASGTPVICTQKSGIYYMFDLEHDCEYRVGEVEAAFLSDEAYVCFEHLPGKSLTMKEVYKFGAAKLQKSDIAVYFTLFLITTFIGLLLPLLNKKIYDTLIPLGRFKSIVQVGGVIFACMIGNVFFDIVKNLASFRGVKLAEYSIVSATYERIFRLPHKFIEEFGTMELVNRVNSITGVFSSTVNSGISAIVGTVLGIFYLWRMFDESSKLAWRALIISVISAVVMYGFGRLRIAKERERLAAANKANGMLYQFLSGILRIKVSGSENRALYEFEKVNVDSLEYDVRSTRIQNIGNAVSSVMYVFCTGFIYYTVVKKKQSLTIGDYAAFNSAFGLFQSAVNRLVSFFLTLSGLVPVLERVEPIYKQEIENKEMPAPLGKLSGDIDISKMCFSYDKDEGQVLSDIDMHIKSGEFIGIVGPTGCGKSTLLKLLLGFEEPDSGKIMYDGRDISSYDICELRRRIGTVLQDGKLITGNIFTNVTLSAPNLNAEGVEKLLEEVGLSDDISKMPMGIFTSISEGGGTVSGGQQQRILIARALANKPSIMLLDEATSALDNLTQLKVCENLAKRNITRIMIAHRLSTVENCDRIYVFDKGKIMESGNYKELIDKKGLFYELAKRQRIDKDK